MKGNTFQEDKVICLHSDHCSFCLLVGCHTPCDVCVCGQAGRGARTLPGTGLAAPVLSLAQTSPCTAAQLLSSSPGLSLSHVMPDVFTASAFPTDLGFHASLVVVIPLDTRCSF